MYSAYSAEAFSSSVETAEALQHIMPVFIVLGVIMFVSMAVGLVNYILRGLAINKMSKARGLDNGWLGFIPIAHKYQLGKVAGTIEYGNKKVKNVGLWLILAPMIYGAVFTIGYVISLFPFIFSMVALGNDPAPEAVIAPMMTFISIFTIFILIMVVAQVFVMLFKYLALHKIFSDYNRGQKPVYYLILAMFIPLAESILLFKNSNKPLLAATSACEVD